jgi:hypothetical protein
MDTFTKFIIPGIAFLLTLVFGFWLSNAGKPYNGILFNIHKLIALGAVIVVVVQLAQTLKTVNVLAVIVALVLAAICVIALFASGALMSAGKLDYALMLTVHRIAPAVLVVAMALAVYLLEKQP